MKNLETNPKKWESELIQNFEMNYSKQLEMNDKINFLIDTFIEYRNDHSFGEYDTEVIIDEATEIERNELSDFLVLKFTEIQNELKN